MACTVHEKNLTLKSLSRLLIVTLLNHILQSQAWYVEYYSVQSGQTGIWLQWTFILYRIFSKELWHSLLFEAKLGLARSTKSSLYLFIDFIYYFLCFRYRWGFRAGCRWAVSTGKWREIKRTKVLGFVFRWRLYELLLGKFILVMVTSYPYFPLFFSKAKMATTDFFACDYMLGNNLQWTSIHSKTRSQGFSFEIWEGKAHSHRIPIALFASLSRGGLGTRNEGPFVSRA